LKRQHHDDDEELAKASDVSGPATKKPRIDTARAKKATDVPVTKNATAFNKVSF
jgi:hypothetical protein